VRAVLRPALVGAGCAAIGLAWWVRNVILFGVIQPSGYPPGFDEGLPPGHLSFVQWVGGFLDTFASTFWLNYGLAEMKPAFWAYIGASILVLGAIGVALLRARDTRPLVGFVQLSWVGSFVIIVYGSFQMWETTGAVRAAQGRYIFGGIAALIAAVAIAVQPRISRYHWYFAAVPVLAAVAAYAAMQRAVVHFYAGQSLREHVGTFSAWSPVQLRFSFGLLFLTALSSALAGLLLTREARRPTLPVGSAVVPEVAR
jgi:hypothetical protein